MRSRDREWVSEREISMSSSFDGIHILSRSFPAISMQNGSNKSQKFVPTKVDSKRLSYVRPSFTRYNYVKIGLLENSLSRSWNYDINNWCLLLENAFRMAFCLTSWSWKRHKNLYREKKTKNELNLKQKRITQIEHDM